MAKLKYKKDGAWTELADSFPVDVPVEVTEMDAELMTLNATTNGIYAAAPAYDAFDKVIVNVSVLPTVIRAGDTPVALSPITQRASSSSSMAATGASITVPKAGTYRFKWGVGEANGSRYTVTTQLYKNGSAAGDSHVSDAPEALTEDLTCTAGDVIALYAKGYSDSGTYGMIGHLTACIDWNIWG